ncbi:PTS sugar transporter subunit IIA [Lederbergia galactosidilytica]|uniref:PTS glucose transporter subunit IIA n=1 Tax=Lederbergia galactosidilytica TaxID=217031 RepID=A0A0Q9XZP3_9BACI|nr:PTS glucose transporter subunit IIA [Lederbergia galactosidilytica]KRG14239.1 PTS glucose transporter subunit IIA [Lederbergia galactosidilytica]KRG15059.1 PTS glucose transporter subunit IIA [Virgibacillus soli]MBP1913332.1 PTS system glucose-specific IIA component [Lederbergia galactosidilytica]OAK67974.1 PTS glucose transporter subunit IIA [Lederbergia galactosidilytica]
MFKKLFKKEAKEKREIVAPIAGEIIPLEEVPDPVFSQKMMGEGIAIQPSGGQIVAPVDGKIILIAETKHALGIAAKDGTEILIHVGLETVSLKGEGFTVLTKMDEVITVGQPLLEVDWDYIASHTKSSVTPIIMTKANEDGDGYKPVGKGKAIAGETVILTTSES